MPEPVIEVRGLTEFIERMQKYPQKLQAVLKIGVDATLALCGRGRTSGCQFRRVGDNTGRGVG